MNQFVIGSGYKAYHPITSRFQDALHPFLSGSKRARDGFAKLTPQPGTDSPLS